MARRLSVDEILAAKLKKGRCGWHKVGGRLPRKFVDEKLPHQSSVLTPKKFHFSLASLWLPVNRCDEKQIMDYSSFFSNAALQDVVIKPHWEKESWFIALWSTFNVGRRGRRLIEKRFSSAFKSTRDNVEGPKRPVLSPRRKRKCIFRSNKTNEFQRS